jgi:hypothetical protein
MRRWGTAILALGLALTGCGGSSTSSTSSSGTGQGSVTQSSLPPGTWTGFGAPLQDFEADHQKAPPSNACACYGLPLTRHGQIIWEFSALMTSPEGRVDGFQYSFDADTDIVSARATIMSLMPRDAVPVAFRVSHQNGSCALLDLHSKTLAKWLGTKDECDTNGNAGIELFKALPDGSSEYDPKDITDGTVSIGNVGSGSVGC